MANSRDEELRRAIYKRKGLDISKDFAENWHVRPIPRITPYRPESNAGNPNVWDYARAQEAERRITEREINQPLFSINRDDYEAFRNTAPRTITATEALNRMRQRESFQTEVRNPWRAIMDEFVGESPNRIDDVIKGLFTENFLKTTRQLSRIIKRMVIWKQ